VHFALVRCVLYQGNDKVHMIDDKTEGSPLYNQYRKTEVWIKDKMKVVYMIERMGSRKEIWEIPLTV
jgi:ATP-dependent DNA helicase RecG